MRSICVQSQSFRDSICVCIQRKNASQWSWISDHRALVKSKMFNYSLRYAIIENRIVFAWIIMNKLLLPRNYFESLKCRLHHDISVAFIDKNKSMRISVRMFLQNVSIINGCLFISFEYSIFTMTIATARTN